MQNHQPLEMTEGEAFQARQSIPTWVQSVKLTSDDEKSLIEIVCDPHQSFDFFKFEDQVLRIRANPRKDEETA